MKMFVLGCLFSVASLFVALFLIVELGLYPINADADPHWLERAMVQKAVDAYVQANSKRLTNPLPSSTEVLISGMKTFKSHCAQCHGSPTQPDATFGNSFFPRAPQFSLKGLDDETKEIFWRIKHGIRMTGMPAF